MDAYYCIVSTAVEEVADLCVLDAHDDAAALARARGHVESVPGWTRIRVYEGERPVGLLESAAPPEALPLAA
ncbi:hypothetical protein [Brevundimonas sp.]|uniref:hypothetical protein n=1 Tax=Brevundimonas sp. TaxID=1871086 RepID=UPI002D22CEEE|nr:hypothetical protein [Brevundimonas sp.]HYC68590.1 hypothetical protein [Brevundimonas sp.]